MFLRAFGSRLDMPPVAVCMNATTPRPALCHHCLHVQRPHSTTVPSSLPCKASRNHSHRQTTRKLLVPQALPSFLQQLLGQQPPKVDSATSQASAELLELLLLGEDAAGGGGDAARAGELVQQLSTSQQPFQEQLLGGGPWQVRYSAGSFVPWQLPFKAGKLVAPKTSAEQDLDPSRRTVVNRVELPGGSVCLSAEGTYEPQGQVAQMPVTVQANIQSGCITIGSWQIGLPISGKGTFQVLYLDSRLRVFRSGRAVVVQVRQESG